MLTRQTLGDKKEVERMRDKAEQEERRKTAHDQWMTAIGDHEPHGQEDEVQVYMEEQYGVEISRVAARELSKEIVELAEEYQEEDIDWTVNPFTGTFQGRRKNTPFEDLLREALEEVCGDYFRASIEAALDTRQCR